MASLTPAERAAAIVLLLAGAGPALALDAELSVGYTGEYSTNTTLASSDDDEVDEWIHLPGADLRLRQGGAAVDMAADYRVERRIYEEELFDDETAVRGTADIVWHALPERLDFNLRNTRAESTIRARQPNTEANRQTVSITEAGPTLRLRPQSNAEFQIEYLYADVSVEETNTDSERQTGTARYVLDLSSIRTLTLEASRQDVEFDDPVAPDLETTLGMLTLDHAGRELTYSLGGGYNRTKRELGRDTVDGAVFDVNVQWTPRPASTLSLEASRDIRDQSSTLLAGGGGRGDFIDEETDVNEVFTETRGAATWSQRVGANDLSLTLSATEEDYEDIARDSERLAVAVGLNRALTPRTSLRGRIELGNREFLDTDEEYDEIRGSLDLTRRLSRRFTVTVGAYYEERDSDEIAESSYDEWVGRISLTYRVFGEDLR